MGINFETNMAVSTPKTRHTAKSNASKTVTTINYPKTQKNDAERAKEIKANEHYLKDLKTGRLKEKDVKILGIKIGTVYEYKVQKDKYGAKESLGDIKRRYNLPNGTFEELIAAGKADTELLMEGESFNKATPRDNVIQIKSYFMNKGIGKD